MTDLKAVYWAAVQNEIRGIFDEPQGAMAEAAWQAVNADLNEPVKSGLEAVAAAAWEEGQTTAWDVEPDPSDPSGMTPMQVPPENPYKH